MSSDMYKVITECMSEGARLLTNVETLRVKALFEGKRNWMNNFYF